MPSSATQSCSSRMPGVSMIERPARELDQLAADRRVTALAVIPDLLRRQELLSGERVDERRLADSRRAQEHGGQAGRELLPDHLEPRPRLARDRDDGNASCDGLDLCHRRLGRCMEIRFRQHDHGPGAALPRQDQVALQASEAEILVHRRDEEGDVDIRCEHLLLGRLPGGLAGELGEARQDGRDCPGVVFRPGGDDDPVTDDRQVGVRLGLVHEAARQVAAKLAVHGEHVVGAAMLNGHASRDDLVAGKRLVQRAQPVSPAERFQFRQAKLPFAFGKPRWKSVSRLPKRGRFCTLRVILKRGTYGSP